MSVACTMTSSMYKNKFLPSTLLMMSLKCCVHIADTSVDTIFVPLTVTSSKRNVHLISGVRLHVLDEVLDDSTSHHIILYLAKDYLYFMVSISVIDPNAMLS